MLCTLLWYLQLYCNSSGIRVLFWFLGSNYSWKVARSSWEEKTCDQVRFLWFSSKWVRTFCTAYFKSSCFYHPSREKLLKRKLLTVYQLLQHIKKLLTSQSSRHPFALISIADYRTYPDKRLSVALYHCHMAGRAHCYGVTVACQRWNINMIEPGPYQLFHLSHTNTNTYVMLL